MGAAYLGVPCAVKNRPALDAAYLPFLRGGTLI